MKPVTNEVELVNPFAQKIVRHSPGGSYVSNDMLKTVLWTWEKFPRRQVASVTKGYECRARFVRLQAEREDGHFFRLLSCRGWMLIDI